MRHQKRTHKLNRTPAHRQALWRNQATALLRHESMQTTLAKAKALRGVVEPLITLAKQGTLHARRLAHRRVRDQEILAKLFDDIAPRFSDRAGGYTRVFKNGFRAGDNAPMAVIQLVDFQANASDATQTPTSQTPENPQQSNALPPAAEGSSTAK